MRNSHNISNENRVSSDLSQLPIRTQSWQSNTINQNLGYVQAQLNYKVPVILSNKIAEISIEGDSVPHSATASQELEANFNLKATDMQFQRVHDQKNETENFLRNHETILP